MKKNFLLLFVLLCAYCSNAAVKRALSTPGTTIPLNWNNGFAWNNGTVPAAGDDVIIEDGAEIIINVNINVNSLMVMGSLTVSNALNNADIKTRYMVIMGANASFTWGTEANHYVNTGSLTLMGKDSTDRITDPMVVMMMGNNVFNKGILVMGGGRLDIHGEQRTAWTHLVVTANIGDNTITLATDKSVSGWSVGDSIVIASTDYDPNHAERRKITKIEGKVITLSSSLTWMHFAQILTYKSGTKSYDQRAEVGLITRNITVQGEYTLTGGNPTNQYYGGYIMSMVGASTKIDNIKLFNMGQLGHKGAYPMHWHIAGNAAGQYIKYCTIRNSFNRAVVIHGSDSILVQQNVVYDHMGHGFMLEDGDEENNTFNANLGITTRAAAQGKGIEPGENTEPSTFWITNPNNTYTGNVAAGSTNTGFWLIPVTTVLRNSYLKKTTTYSPRKFPLKKFEDNVGHTCTNKNLALEGDMDTATRKAIFFPPYPLLDVNGAKLEHVFTRFISYKGAQNGVWTRGGVTNTFDDCVFGDASFMAFLSYNAVVKNSMFVGITPNTGTQSYFIPNKGELLGLQMYNGSTDVSNTHLAGFTSSAKTVCIGNRRSSGKYPNFSATSITFENDGTQNNKVNFSYQSLEEDPSRSYHFVAGMIDSNGSISGTTLGRITPRIYNTKTSNPAYNNRIFDYRFNLPFNLTKATLRADWSAYITTGTRYAMLQNWPGWGFGTSYGEDRFIYAIRSDGPATFDQLLRGYDSQFPIILDENIKYITQYHQMPNTIRSEFRWAGKQNDSTIAVFVNVPSATTVKNETITMVPKASLAALENSRTTGYYLKDNTLYVKYFATLVDEGLNTSGVRTDYSAPDIYITTNADGTTTGFSDFVTLADFTNGIDARGSLARVGDMNFGTIANGGGTNTFSLIKGSATTNDFVDYNFNFVTRQIWREFKKLSIKYKGPKVDILIRDTTGGTTTFTTLGTIPATTTLQVYDVNLANIAPANTTSLNQVKFRFYETDLTSATAQVIIDEMTLSLEPAITNIINVNPTVLPVDLINFYGKSTQLSNQLFWATSAEINNAYFNIQRSINSNAFSTIGSVKGSGNSNATSNYTFEDKNMPIGKCYYRLEQVDVNGLSKLSNIIELGTDKALTVSSYPNPFTQSFTITTNSQKPVNVSIIDQYGRTLENKIVTSQKPITLGLNLPKGVYFLCSNVNGISNTQKMIKQ